MICTDFLETHQAVNNDGWKKEFSKNKHNLCNLRGGGEIRMKVKNIISTNETETSRTSLPSYISLNSTVIFNIAYISVNFCIHETSETFVKGQTI